MTCIRFQLQMADGTENSIIMNKMYFTGKLDKIYTAPPEYIPITMKVKYNNYKQNNSYKLVNNNQRLNLQLPLSFANGTASLYDISGKQIQSVRISKDACVSWNFSGSNQTRISSGRYFIAVQNRTERIVIPFMHTN